MVIMTSLRYFTESSFYCTRCEEKGIDIPRKSGRYRGAGHLKKLYWIHCGKTWNHVEIRSMYSDYNYEDFKTELKYNNFDEKIEKNLIEFLEEN